MRSSRTAAGPPPPRAGQPAETLDPSAQSSEPKPPADARFGEGMRIEEGVPYISAGGRDVEGGEGEVAGARARAGKAEVGKRRELR